MVLQFSRVPNPLEEMEIWNASSNDFSFVISYESRAGRGFHGQPGYVASWRPLAHNRTAVRVTGSPFKTFTEAEKACEATLGVLIRQRV